MIVVSNSSPLIALAQIDQLQLLQQLYNEIRIPTAVQREVAIPNSKYPDSVDIALLQWLRVEAVSNQMAISFLRERLDAGESEAIVLAIEQEADLLLIDEARGRRVAQAQGVPHIGTIGILILAKRQTLIPSVTMLLEQLIPFGFRMDAALFLQAKKLAGED